MKLDADRMADFHTPFQTGNVGPDTTRCINCNTSWPCDVSALLAALDVATEALESFVDVRHHQRQGSTLCDWCGLRWPCDNEDARDALSILQGQAEIPEKTE